jgi:hypothetical protein
MAGISNHYISSVLLPFCSEFRGVFSCNTIPAQLLQLERFSIVCNLSKAGEAGSHFVAIIVNPERALYLDSFGLPCVVLEISNFLRRLKKPVFYSTQQVQHFKSKLCGFYCILFVLHFNDPSSSPLLFETEDLFANDAACVKKICKLLNKVY